MSDDYRKEWFGRSDSEQFIIDCVDDLLMWDPGPVMGTVIGVIGAVVVFFGIGFCFWPTQ